MNTKALLRHLSRFYPQSIAKNYHDSVGTMVGPLPKNMETIILCLDVNKTVVEEAIARKADCILSHHPFFYGDKHAILRQDPVKAEIVQTLQQHAIAVLSYHTNFDAGKDGMNDALAQRLHLQSVYAPAAMPMMRIGELSQAMDIETFARYVKETFQLTYVHAIQASKTEVKKVGIIGGGGAQYFSFAQQEGCDCFISGDIRHHIRQDILQSGIHYLDIPHEVERIFMETMAKKIKEKDDQVVLVIVDDQQEMLSY